MTAPEDGRIELHSHTFLSDGELSPVELLSRARDLGYEAIAVTDHAGPGIVERIVREVQPACDVADDWGLVALAGVEITHVPPDRIADVAEQAREAGAQVVVVHGETPVEPVPEGTNRAAASCPDVDVLGHPGRIQEDVARQAVENEVALEITSRRGHCLANGHVADVARRVGADLVVDADAHAPTDLMTPSRAREVALGAGLTAKEAAEALRETPRRIVERRR